MFKIILYNLTLFKIFHMRGKLAFIYSLCRTFFVLFPFGYTKVQVSILAISLATENQGWQFVSTFYAYFISMLILMATRKNKLMYFPDLAMNGVLKIKTYRIFFFLSKLCFYALFLIYRHNFENFCY